MNLGEKIFALREEQGITQEELAKELNITSRTLQNYEYGISEPKFDTIKQLSKLFNVNIDFFTSSNDVVSQNKKDVVSSRKPVVSPKNSTVKKQDLKLSQDNFSVPYFDDVYASAGGGYINDENSSKSLEFSKSFIRDYLGTTEFSRLNVIKSKGDSMEPTIPKNALLFIRLGDVKEGQICVARIDDELYVKRLQKRPVVKLISDNPDYDPITLHEDEDFELIGTVLGYIKRF